MTTWTEQRDIDKKPKVQFMMMSYDEMIPEPNKAIKSRYKRLQPQFTFLTPKGFDTQAFGATLELIGKEMKLGHS